MWKSSVSIREPCNSSIGDEFLMYFRGVSCITFDRVLKIWFISFHGVSLHHITLYISFLFEYVVYWFWTLHDIWLFLLINIMLNCKIIRLFSYILLSLIFLFGLGDILVTHCFILHLLHSCVGQIKFQIGAYFMEFF